MFQNDLDVEIMFCFEDYFIMGSLSLNSFMSNYVMLGFSGQIKFQWFMFRVGFSGLCFSGLFWYISS
jgi:hypothetical protein